MKKALSFIITAVMILSLSVCAFAEEKVTLNVYNWGEYIDQEVIELFEAEYPDITVNYTTYDSNESMYSKMISGAASYDVVIPSDYMVSKLINEDLIYELDFDNIPNYRYIGEAYKNQAHDPENKYSVPYLWGTVVVMYNSAYVDEADVENQSLDLLWNEKYAGKILMFDNPRDAFCLALLKLGYSMNSETHSEWDEAAVLLSEQKPLVQAYVMDAIFDKMESEEAWIAPYYAGDAYYIADGNPNIKYYIPSEGTNMFMDSMCILNTSEHKTEAELFINFMCDPEISRMNAEAVGYSTPNTETLKMLDEELIGNDILYPSTEFLIENTDVFKNLSQSTQILQSNLWTSLKIEESAESSALDWIDIFCIGIVAIGITSAVYFGIRSKKRKKLWKS
ncbi:MAG: spermidine/putrescine ABC transporter substrate-binding protein [Clostridia bacterium]|nr:spermidine/putrescine ABC transporter substrate-binding protein [Clostridia bacterium]